ncbi:hypothetical protein MXMO3_02012 [Maritalea myrionectae]|uniref:Uncharacterized protein n=1 Tax=Maritalea myrionectae TaxID=454601 RepID=A0A2R4MF64_9HYPH|nr:hypothetical protein MXMO3_02012 [Maritalea myrionectae]
MSVRAKTSVTGSFATTLSNWMVQVGFNSFAYRLAHIQMPRHFLSVGLALVFFFV